MQFTKKRVAVVGATTAVALAGAGVGFAYFTSTGSGHDSGAVGSATNWGVSVTVDRTATLYPGQNSQNVGFTVTNNGSGYQGLSSVTVTVKHNADGNAYDDTTGVYKSGCLASWFTIDGTATAKTYSTVKDLAPNGTWVAGTATDDQVAPVLSLPDSGTNQDACQGVTPEITVDAS